MSVSGRFIRSFILLILAMLLAVTGIVVLFDPFYVYHAPLPGLKKVLSDKEYQCVGSLRHFDYNSLVAGSSVTENNNTRWYDELFSVRTEKAVRSYGATADLMYLLDVAHESHQLKYVFYNIDPTSLAADPVTTYESTGCPVYLYDRNPLNDYSYWLNKDVLFEKIPYQIVRSLSGYDEGTGYNWWESKDFSASGALSHYYRREEILPMQPEDALSGNLDANISLLVNETASHPETMYYYFFPPYSMLWWDNEYRTGELDAVLSNELKCMEALLALDNARVFFFQGDEEIITDLDLYMDALHFKPEINHLMAERMATGEGEVLPGEAGEAVAGFKDLVLRIEEEILPGVLEGR